jgi:hypothetical protein
MINGLWAVVQEGCEDTAWVYDDPDDAEQHARDLADDHGDPVSVYKLVPVAKFRPANMD